MTDEEIKLRCIEMAAKLCIAKHWNPTLGNIIHEGDKLYKLVHPYLKKDEILTEDSI